MTVIDAFFTVILQGERSHWCASDVVLRTGMFANRSLPLIFFLSVFAWAIMYHKYRQFKSLFA